ncbi:MAG TPA: 3-hydroxyacyl-CoA dehydrogenase NAD-binding domain-containing protein [Bradyrhizobium sp.]
MTSSDSTAEIAGPVGVVGTGLMGLGIAQAVASAGFAVVLCGRNAEASHQGLNEGPRALWLGLADLYPSAAAQPDEGSVRLRLLAAQAREVLRCLEDGVIESADDADAASVFGLGFPKPLGGVARWVEDFGLGELVALCRCLAKAHSGRFASTSWLDGLAASGKGLSDFRKQEISS